MYKVIYASKGGKTAKVADTIAKAIGVQAEAVDAAGKMENVEVLFVGSGIYAGNIDQALLAFLKELPEEQIKKVAFFTTSAMQKNQSAVEEVGNILTEKGIPLSKEVYNGKGRFLFINRKHPNAEDLQAAEVFAKKTIATHD
ncbi:MAG: flavodoxin family protein [Christensenellaceae bacterium]|jgi:flavodoxin